MAGVLGPDPLDKHLRVKWVRDNTFCASYHTLLPLLSNQLLNQKSPTYDFKIPSVSFCAHNEDSS